MSNRPTILAVDDEQMIVQMLKEVLTMEGFPVEVAMDGQQAVQFIEQSPQTPRIMLLDLNMPVMDGWAVIRWLTERPENRARTKIIAISANQYLATVTDDQVDGKLSKPLSVDTLLAKIDAVS